MGGHGGPPLRKMLVNPELRGRAKAIGPIVHAPGVSMQGSRLCLIERLKNSRTIVEAFK